MKIGDLVKDVVFNVGGIGIILKTNHHLYEVQFSDGIKRWLVGKIYKWSKNVLDYFSQSVILYR